MALNPKPYNLNSSFHLIFLYPNTTPIYSPYKTPILPVASIVFSIIPIGRWTQNKLQVPGIEVQDPGGRSVAFVALGIQTFPV